MPYRQAREGVPYTVRPCTRTVFHTAIDGRLYGYTVDKYLHYYK